MEPEGSLPCSQEPSSSGPYPEPDKYIMYNSYIENHLKWHFKPRLSSC
jgi:hypothetical protein